MIYLAAFIVSFFRVFARSFQQLNVVTYRWGWVPMFSYLMAAGDAFLWGAAGWFALNEDALGLGIFVLITGTGGWMGTYTSMWIHQRWK